MATKVYSTKNIYLFDGTEIEISPLKIKYLREFMDTFALINKTENDDDSILLLLECVRIAMKQYRPELSTSTSDIENAIDMPTIHEILEIAGGIKITEESEETVKQQVENNKSKNSWEDIDLVKLESEVFTLGIWKNYDDLESHISMPELMAIISGRRELDYEEKKFLAAIQGVDIDKNQDRGQKEWEDLKARVFSKGQTTDSKDILALQGQNAVKAGFGIGMGLDYEDLR
ncbi:MAG: hypothetical protein FJ356_00640 [Thaumarchaeota archaeon]|nr:hypothetical protein [Nitrososphaerota archaeon]